MTDAVTQVLDYRSPLADRQFSRLTDWLATPMSTRWRTATLVSAGAALWGSAWLPGATIVENAGWIGLAACAARWLRGPMRWMVGLTRRAFIPTPASERYATWQSALLILALSAFFYPWPLHVNLVLHRPLLDRFAWDAYANTPMLAPPSTPRMVGLFFVTEVRAAPHDVTLDVFGSDSVLYYTPPDARAEWLAKERIPWLLRCVTPADSGAWTVEQRRYARRLR